MHIFAVVCLSLFPAIHVLADEPARVSPAVIEKPAPDPKAPCASYLDAVRHCDIEAALKCFVYEERDAAAMKVTVGIWIAHRRFEKAVDARSV